MPQRLHLRILLVGAGVLIASTTATALAQTSPPAPTSSASAAAPTASSAPIPATTAPPPIASTPPTVPTPPTAATAPIPPAAASPATAATAPAEPGYGSAAPVPSSSVPALSPSQMARAWEIMQREAAESWKPGEPVPQGYRKVRDIREGLVQGGAILGTLVWIVGEIVAAAVSKETHGRFDALYVPIAGPFIGLATARPDFVESFVFLLDGATQVGCLGMVASGLIFKETQLVRNAPVTPVPFTPDNKTVGLGLVGSF
jgi:hypothetical protein